MSCCDGSRDARVLGHGDMFYIHLSGLIDFVQESLQCYALFMVKFPRVHMGSLCASLLSSEKTLAML